MTKPQIEKAGKIDQTMMPSLSKNLVDEDLYARHTNAWIDLQPSQETPLSDNRSLWQRLRFFVGVNWPW